MKRITWNNLHAFRTCNQHWRLLESVSVERLRRNTHYVFFTEDGRRMICDGPYSNVWYAAIAADFCAMFGKKDFALYEHHTLGAKFEVYIHTAVSPLLGYDVTFTIYARQSERYAIRPPGNMEYTPENIRRFVLAWINKHVLFGQGRFRDMQLHEGLSKADVATRARKEKTYRPAMSYDENATIHALKKTMNVDVENVGLIAGIAWINRHGKQSRLVELHHFDTSWQLDVDGDIDDFERAYWAAVEEYPENAVFV